MTRLGNAEMMIAYTGVCVSPLLAIYKCYWYPSKEREECGCLGQSTRRKQFMLGIDGHGQDGIFEKDIRRYPRHRNIAEKQEGIKETWSGHGGVNPDFRAGLEKNKF